VTDQLRAHLEATYGIAVADISTLDKGVFRVERRDGDPWVARVFPAGRPRAVVEADAEIMRGLERNGFPAERCATAAPVSTMDDRAVLVTGFVTGERPAERARTYAILGALLGRLHARAAVDLRPGGAWHHLCPQGTPRDEIAAALAMIDEAPFADADRPAVAAVRAAVADLDDAADLPHAFVHPDFVTANAIGVDDALVMTDWSGAGRGPRIWSLAFLLWAAGNRDPRLIDWVVSRYRRHTQLDPDELARLEGVIAGRPLTLTVWTMCQRYRKPAAVRAGLANDRKKAAEIAERARAAFVAPEQP
jgi:Ser/Thr protein kinase RdoA (MazF antagonist)